jgi:hypothetical protein
VIGVGEHGLVLMEVADAVFEDEVLMTRRERPRTWNIRMAARKETVMAQPFPGEGVDRGGPGAADADFHVDDRIRERRDAGGALVPRDSGVDSWGRATRIKAVLAGLSIVVGLLFAVQPRDWIEDLFGFEPDAGSGLLELGFVLLPIAAGLVLAANVHASLRARQSSRMSTSTRDA